MNFKILITGSAGFIGYHLSKKLCDSDWNVVGLDNLNDYYDVNLKQARINLLSKYNNFKFIKSDLVCSEEINNLFELEKFDYVVNLAAQAGVRYSIKNPHAYIESNIKGFLNILEGCRNFPVKHLIFASSSSVYGANTHIPFSIHDNVDHPVSLYAATKKSNELMAHTYSSLFNIPATGLRFFTVYGPWGRPDMAYFSFTKAIFEQKPINVFNYGKMKRDFTYIDDIVESINRLIKKPASSNPTWSGNKPDPGISYAPYRIFNVGNNQPIELEYFIEILQKYIGIKAIKNLLPMQPGDVPITYADIDDLKNEINFTPQTSIEQGLKNFIDWYRSFYSQNI